MFVLDIAGVSIGSFFSRRDIGGFRDRSCCCCSVLPGWVGLLLIAPFSRPDISPIMVITLPTLPPHKQGEGSSGERQVRKRR